MTKVARTDKTGAVTATANPIPNDKEPLGAHIADGDQSRPRITAMSAYKRLVKLKAIAGPNAWAFANWGKPATTPQANPKQPIVITLPAQPV